MEKIERKNISFDVKHEELRKVYGNFNWNAINNPLLQKTWWQHGDQSKYSDNSYSFIIKDIDNKDISKKHIDSIKDVLTDIFGLSEKTIFGDKLKEACSGNGDEARKITTVHSSSLCALLFFYKVSESNPIILDINNEKIKFTNVFFEFKNVCIEGRNPSNIDILLVSKDTKTVLMLESKFAEYLSLSKALKISNAYWDIEKCPIGNRIYTQENIKKIFGDNSFLKNDPNKEFSIKTNSYAYIDGIKQMISHFIGAVNLSNHKYYDKRSEKIAQNAEHIYLGTILFDFPNESDALNNYEELYSRFCNVINSEFKEKVKLLSKPLHYSEYAKQNKNDIDLQVYQFYLSRTN